MLNIFRRIPHPNYGNYGGAYNKCSGPNCPIPIDWMDVAFAQHDIDLGEKTPLADHKLGKKLQKGNPKELRVKPYWYAFAYYWTCKYILFRPQKTV